MEYNFRGIETKWQKKWTDANAYRVSNDSPKPKFYVLDMFPYPSGAGLHVGHPLGYIASDIFARYKRLKGFNVLHPMGYDAFGLPAEQYAIEHGIHPAVSTKQNIENFRKQLDKIGFSFDWEREVNTSQPEFYKWTQWIFLQLFDSWYNRTAQKAERIATLIKFFESEGNALHECPGDASIKFSADEWKNFSEKEQQDILMHYRLAYCGIGEVNWCEALGTVLANDEVINGVSERGGFPVVKKKLRQWYMRITEYADRLLQGLELVDFSEAMKDMQRNWIGKSSGAEIDFPIVDEAEKIKVYTTRPDTIFGVDFMVLSPEHELVEKITTHKHRKEVEEYIAYVKSRSERERMAEKKISGCFTGTYALNPFNSRQIPVWISEYVLAGYGTGAIMAVPCGDERDHKFATHFNIPITNILGNKYTGEPNPTKDAELENSDFLTGMLMSDAWTVIMDEIEGLSYGKQKVNYKMRDAAFSRQRYWGEPFPIVWKNGIAYPLDEKELPLLLPEMQDIKPGADGEGPLSNNHEWLQYNGGEREASTMPGYAGSSWYFLRYMDAHNEEEFCSRKASDYWGQVDLYIGGTEHAVGHLLYSRMWTKALYDLGYIGHDEPYKRLVNQGMIQGSSRYVYRAQFHIEDLKANRISQTNQILISYELIEAFDNAKEGIIELLNRLSKLDSEINKFKEQHRGEENEIGVRLSPYPINVNLVDGLEISIGHLSSAYPDTIIVTENGKFLCKAETEKMSKRLYNVVNPDDLCNKYGADTFRMYEMFLGPVEQSKPWDTKGIEGVHRFLRKLWRLFYDDLKGKLWIEEKATAEELKVLHKAIKKIQEDTERFSFNTAVSAFMVCVNELTDLKCSKREVLEPLLILLTPYAPHISEELWSLLCNTSSILDAAYPVFNEKFVAETSKEYPVSVNGKLRTTIMLSLNATQQEAEQAALSSDVVIKWLDGKEPKKIVYVKNKMINVVV